MDTKHEISCPDGIFKLHGAELHRFKNSAGVDYSAIYRGGFEEMSCERRDEKVMITAFRKRLFYEMTGREWI